MQRQHLNPRELARRAEVKSSFIYDVLNGRSHNPSTLQLARIAQSLNVPLSMLVSDEAAATAMPSLHVVQQAAFDGWLHPPAFSTASHSRPCPYSFSHRFLGQQLGLRAEQLSWSTMGDDTMEPSLKLGDTLLIDRSHIRPSPAGLYLIRDGDAINIRRIEAINTHSAHYLRIIADNPCYATYEKHAESVIIMGRVVWMARQLAHSGWPQIS